MRLTIALLGFTFDASIEPTAADEDRAGDTTSYPVGFARHSPPEEIPLPQRTPAWDEPEERGR